MGEAARRIDVIDTAPLFAVHDAAALDARFGDSSAENLIDSVLSQGLAGHVATVSSFGADSAVLLYLISRVDRGVPVLFLDTGKHFPETLAYRDALVERLGLTSVTTISPDADALATRDASGLRWSYDPDGCCELRKVQPLARAMEGFDATFTGRKAFQNDVRAALPRFEIDGSDAAGRLKINPLARWTRADIEACFVQNDLPRHPLIAQGFLSIGCAPCTSKVAPGEDPRSGRWRGWDKTECGIHQPAPATTLPPGFDPAF